MTDVPTHYQDAIHEAQFAVTQAEELLDLAQGRLAKAKREYLERFLQPAAPTLVSAGFTMRPADAPTCLPCRTGVTGTHDGYDPQCKLK